MKAEIYEDAAYEWRWRAIEANGRIIAVSGEGYVTRAGAERGFDNVVNEIRGEVHVVTRPRPGELARGEVELLTLEPGGHGYIALAQYDAEGAH